MRKNLPRITRPERGGSPAKTIRESAEEFIRRSHPEQPESAEHAADIIRLRLEWLTAAIIQGEQFGVRTWISIDSDEANPKVKHSVRHRLSVDI